MGLTIERTMGYMTRWHDANRRGKRLPIVEPEAGICHHDEFPDKNCNKLTRSAQKNAWSNRTQTMHFHPAPFTGKDPRKGWRTPLNQIKCSEQRDEETGYGYFGARYMDHELTTMWLSVDPMSDKYPNISPYAYCAWSPVRLVDPDGREIGDYYSIKGKYLGSDMKDDGMVHVVKDPNAVKTENGVCTTIEANIAFSANYETFQEIENVYHRTIDNSKGQNEECSAIIGHAILRGETGWWDESGPHCNYPLKFGWTINGKTGEMEENPAIQLTTLGHTSIHSHPFNHPNPNRFCLNTPSADDMKNVFSWATLNVIIGYSSTPTFQYPTSLSGVDAAFYDRSGTKLGSMKIEAIMSINKHRKTAPK